MPTLGRLKSLGLTAPWQAALYPPVEYLDYRNPITIFNPNNLQIGQTAVFAGRLDPHSIELEYKQSIRLKARLVDEQGSTLRFMFFTDKRKLDKVKEALFATEWIGLYGEVSVCGHQLWCHKAKQVPQAELGKVIPLYAGKRGVVKPETILEWQKTNLATVLPEAEQKLREYLVKMVDSTAILRSVIQCHSMTLYEVLEQAHFPLTPEVGEQSLAILERISAVAMLSELKAIGERQINQQRKSLDLSRWQENLAGLPFPLTQEQGQAVTGLIAELSKQHVTKSMLIGDVGSGKTAVYGLVVAAVIKAGGRVAIMLPAKNLAEEKHQEFRQYWPELDAQLVCDGSTITNENSRLWIGTTGLISRNWDKEFYLVVIDEQHKFGTEQRNVLVSSKTSVLEVTATPIPRSYCWMRHGLIPVFTLKECHVKKEFISTIYFKDQGRTLLKSVFNSLNNGSKVLII